MHKLWTLVKLNFRALLSAVKLGNNKKSRVGGIGAIIFLAALSLYISGVYSFMFGDMLSEVGLLDFLIPIIALIGFFMTIIMTISAASGFVFSNKDTDLMLSLPVSAFSVMLTKILALYLECLVFCALFMLPSGIAYIHYGGIWDAAFIIRLLLGAIFLPVLATLFCVILAWLLSWVTSHAKHKSLVGTIITFIFLAMVMYLSFRSNRLSAILLSSHAQFSSTLHTWLLPFGLLQTGILSSWLAIAEFCLICLIPFLLVVWLFSTRYKKILSGLASNDVRNDYKLGSVRASSAFSALFKKEIRRFFGSTIYLSNTGFGVILLIGASIYGCVAHDKALVMLNRIGGVAGVLPIALLFIGFILSMSNTACVSISLEGKGLWILKESPVPAGTIFKSKAALNLLITWPAVLISMTLLSIFYEIPTASALAMVLVLLVFSVEIALFGLLVNLHFPKMDCANDTIVVKQSASAIIGYFGGLLPLALAFGLHLLIGDLLSFPVFCLVCAALLTAGCTFMWYRLKTWGAEKLVSL